MKDQLEKLYIETFEDEGFDEYLDDFDEYGFTEDQQRHRLFKILDDIERKAKNGSRGILVYRYIHLENIDDLNVANIGQSWTYDKSSAHSWYGGEGDAYILVAEIPVRSIDFWRTVRQNILNPEEKEIGLEPGEKIYLMSIEDTKGNEVESFGTGLICTTSEGNFGEWTG